MSNENKFAIFRVAKLKQGRGGGSLLKSWRHLEKHQESAEISHPELTPYNKYMVNPKVAEKGISRSIRDIIAQHNKVSTKKLRSDASIGAEMLFSYSQPEGTVFDPEYVEQFEKKTLDFIKKEFPCFKPLVIARHCDESSVHWHVIGFCIDKDKKISVAKCLGGPQELSKHQDAFAQEVSFLGLKRGISKKTTGNKHQNKKQWERNQTLADIEAQAKKSLEEIDLLR